jgi:DNA-binding protein H-NS
MPNILTDFKALTLEEQTELYPKLTDVFEASKEAHRRQLRALLAALSDAPGKPAKQKPKYRGPNGETWGGRGALAGWLQKLKDAGEDIERYRV